MGEPERAAHERALTALQAVLSAVALEEGSPPEMAPYGGDRRAQPACVRGGAVTEQHAEEQAGIELFRVCVAGVALQSRRPAAGLDEVADRLRPRLPGRGGTRRNLPHIAQREG